MPLGLFLLARLATPSMVQRGPAPFGMQGPFSVVHVGCLWMDGTYVIPRRVQRQYAVHPEGQKREGTMSSSAYLLFWFCCPRLEHQRVWFWLPGGPESWLDFHRGVLCWASVFSCQQMACWTGLLDVLLVPAVILASMLLPRDARVQIVRLRIYAS
ncbi:hypothetical protein BD289DRAFT_264215 [Coniella lustricola]|uniref:Uncharacterized protein n=1 Tax=Coniella lustricola TaxID=2025994 RepID=A0A2T3A7B9_9PEZI|nr:hypothetical protein BD289DRAFT_264215 [Coniella lustricola]